MAAKEGIRSLFSTQPLASSPKLRIYEYLHFLNQNLQEAVQILRRLEKCPGLRRDLLRSFQTGVEELRAQTNFELIDHLSECEQHDWARFGKLRRQWDRRFEDPDDVYILAERREEDRRKQGLPLRFGIIPHSATAPKVEHLEAGQECKEKRTRKRRS